MTIVIPSNVATQMKMLFPKNDIFSRVWSDLTIEHTDLSVEELDKLNTLVANVKTPSIEDKRLLKRLKSLTQISSVNTTKDLEVMTELLRKHIEGLENQWVFIEDSCAAFYNPYQVTCCKYIPAVSRGENYVPAHIELNCMALMRGDTVVEQLTINKLNIAKGVSASEVLVVNGWLSETEDLRNQYQDAVSKYEEMRGKLGTQYLVSGKGEVTDKSSWRREEVVFEEDGEPSKAVLDDDKEWSNSHNTYHSLGLRKKTPLVNDDEKEEEKVVRLPDHTYVRVFSLRTHEYVIVHSTLCSEYIYNRSLARKLVLEDSTRKLIDLMLSQTKSVGDDVVSGKGKGTIILSSGPPGTGKTLTAEVYAEKAQRPLYVVQCSQLGVTSDQLEDKLSEVLKRAQRWNAILLIDEADVYIRERGGDINQNAVVGVFLRLLEYYKGTMFLTTNRATTVDDAVLSRCIAHVRYEFPSAMDRVRLWEMLSAQFSLTLSAKQIAHLVNEYPVSGRTIKQLCRLMKMSWDDWDAGLPQTFEDYVKWLYQFQKETPS